MRPQRKHDAPNLCGGRRPPVEERKSEGLATRLTFLGIETDSVAMQLRLPEDKLSKLQKLLVQWQGKKGGTKKESLVGSLSHACKVVRYGRSFIRRIIDRTKLTKRPHHFVRLNQEARSDIEWWHKFAASWNGVSLLQSQRNANPDVTVTSDTSGSWGCGALCEEKWFQLQWGTGLEQAHITIKELILIVIAADSAVVADVNWGNSAVPEVMHLLRCLAFIKARCQFSIHASHIRGVHNDLENALSRGNATYFFTHHPQAQPAPMPLPQELLDLLIIAKPDWT